MAFLLLICILVALWFWKRDEWPVARTSWVADIDYTTSTTETTTKLTSNTRRGEAFIGAQTLIVSNLEAKGLVERAKALGLGVRHFFGSALTSGPVSPSLNAPTR